MTLSQNDVLAAIDIVALVAICAGAAWSALRQAIPRGPRGALLPAQVKIGPAPAWAMEPPADVSYLEISPLCLHKPRAKTRLSTLVDNALDQDLIWLRSLIKTFMRLGNGDLILVRPVDQRHDGLQQRSSHVSEFVIDAWRNGRKHRSRDQSIALQPAQGQRQHPLRNAVDAALQLVETPWAVSQHGDDVEAPLVAYAIQYSAGCHTTAGIGGRHIGR